MCATHSKIEREKDTIEVMIRLYCRGHHGEDLCAECSDLIKYTRDRLDRCPFKDDKTACVKCPVHCYRTDEREAIKVVMRYSGPRMAAIHPIMTVRHFIDSAGGVKKLKQAKKKIS